MLNRRVLLSARIESARNHKIGLNHQVAITGIAAVQSESLSAKGRTDVTPCCGSFHEA